MAAFVPKDLKTDNKILLVKINESSPKQIGEFNKEFKKNYKGLFQIVPYYVSVDESYPDVQLYKYVLVISNGMSKGDFNGISNKELFFDHEDSAFINRGSALFIFDRSSNHRLYETGITTMKKDYRTGSEFAMSGKYSTNSSNGPGNYSSYSYVEKTDFRRLKVYIEMLNNF